jgi:hypothetical protein
MYRQKSMEKDLEITPKTKGRFCSYNQNYQFVKILKGVLTDGPNVQNFEKGVRKLQPCARKLEMRASVCSEEADTRRE